MDTPIFRLSADELFALAHETKRRGAAYVTLVDVDYTGDPITLVETDDEHGAERFRVAYDGTILPSTQE